MTAYTTTDYALLMAWRKFLRVLAPLKGRWLAVPLKDISSGQPAMVGFAAVPEKWSPNERIG
jgi:hypothetical protein